MDSDPVSDGNFSKIKDKLNEDKVKLWLSPFLTEKDEINDKEIEALANSYSSQLSIPVEICLECLRILQQKALSNLKDKNHYQSTGIASLKVKVSTKEQKHNVLTVRIELSKDGKSLKEEISKAVSVSVERLKLIFQGKILKDEEILLFQGVKHGAHIMAVVVESNYELPPKDSSSEVLDMTKADVNLLTGDEFNFLQVADQSGKALKLPSKEKKALLLAMTLHEKGRAAIKKDDFTLALVLLLEAEREFSFCNSALLKSVDNYGLLNLDIVWCYLNLQSVNHLPDAEDRLRKCESSFHRSYGPNFERLIALKGSAGNEKVLFVRLYLLQAIVNYHQNKIDEAKKLLEKAEMELKCLVVDEEQLSYLLEIGYEMTEARLALRESMGNVEVAVQIIERKRQERKLNDEKEEQERELEREKRKLGKCVNGDWIEPQFHKALMSMGYSHKVARWALAQSCNNLYSSISLIQEHPEYIPHQALDALVEQVVSMGFRSKHAKRALKKYDGNIDKAVEELVGNQMSRARDSDSSSEDSDSVTGENPGPSGIKKRIEEQRQAYSRVAEDIAESEEDHLDMTLVAETTFLQMYKELISKR